MKKMVVHIDKKGGMKHETFGYDGSECHRVANDVLAVMGQKGIHTESLNVTNKTDAQRNEEERQMEAN